MNRFITVIILIHSLFISCVSDPDAERCATVCADRYGECENTCKRQYQITSAEYTNCKANCEDDYNICVFDCY